MQRELDVEVSAVIGNHPELGDITRAHGIPFHHVPFPSNDPEGKQAAFAQLRQQLAGARKQDDTPGEIERLEREIKQLEAEAERLKSS